MKKRNQRVLAGTLVIGWLGLITLGFALVSIYQNTPGRSATPPSAWPEASNLVQGRGEPTVLLFIHPKCPCSQATLGELERMMPAFHDAATFYLLFVQPEGTDAHWVKAGLWERASQIPDVELLIDEEGFESRLFQAYTSGQVLMYDSAGDVSFVGGITASRGHEGVNDSRLALEAALSGTPVDTGGPLAVFGCPLNSIHADCQDGYCDHED